MKTKAWILITLLFTAFSAFADDDYNSSTYYGPDCPYYLGSPWSTMVYHGELVESNLLDVFSMNLNGDESITSIEFARELPPSNLFRHFFQPFVNTISFATIAGYVTDPNGPIYEIDPYFQFRWYNLWWEKYLVNTYAVGWGVSYDTRVSTWEQHDSDNTKRFLNYLSFEATFGLPQYPRVQLVFKIHHRSGAFGLYGADNSGTNIVGLGLRYYF